MMPLRALITRPREDSENISRDLRQRGIESVIEPMLTIVHGADPPVELANVQAVLFTSANGARAFAAASAERSLPAFAVGEATAAAAREAGFARVESAGGDVAALAELVRRRLDPAKGALFHAAGSVTAGDLAGSLQRSGFTIQRAVLYEAVRASAISPETAALMRQGHVNMVLFFSPRTAATFVTLARKAGLEGTCGGMVAVCLSPAVAEAVGVLPWRDLRSAASPRWPAMLGEIEAAAREAFPAARAAPAAD